MRKRSLLLPLCAVLLLGLTACSSSSSSPDTTVVTPAPDATTLAYTDPLGSGWRLVKDGTSTSTRLVLNLVGPSGLKTRGAGFNLQASAGVKFTTFDSGLPINDTGVYQLHMAGSTDPNDLQAITGGVKKGNILSVGLYQKDRDQAAQDSGVALCQISIALDSTVKLSSGARITLSVLKAKVIPEDIGSVTDDLWTLDKKMRMADISVAVGTLIAQ